MADKKPSLLCVRKILREQTDEDHVLSTNEILDILRKEYGIKLERRALYSNIDLLIEFGDDISRYNENHKGYYMRDRQFSEGEILMLSNAIHASYFIPQEQSAELIQKLLDTQSLMIQEKFYDHVFEENKAKTTNVELLDNIALVSTAIHDEKVITFNYSHYEGDLKLHPRMDEDGKPHLYTMEPRYIAYHDGRPYLVATSEDHDGDYIHYRLDKMSNVKLTRTRVRRMLDLTEAYEYATKKLYMFAGDNVECEMLVEKNTFNALVDEFGYDIEVSEEDENHYRCKVCASRKGLVMLGLQYLDTIVIETEDIKQEIIEHLENGLKRYIK